MTLKLDALIAPPELSISESQLGSNILRYRAPVDVSTVPGAGAAFLSDAQARQVSLPMAEADLVKLVTPELEALLPVGSMQTLVNSEKHPWIETGGEAKFFRKPDMFVVPSSFCFRRSEAEGVLASWRLRDAVAVLLEAKLEAVNEVVGQLARAMEFLCKNETVHLTRYGVALLSTKFYVLEFSGYSVVKVEKCSWAGLGGRELLRKALSHSTMWSKALANLCKGLAVQPTPNGFLGMGAFGRVVKCTRLSDGQDLALKIMVDDEERVLKLQAEFFALKEARAVCAEHVIRVETISDMEMVGGFHCGAYTMELGEPVDIIKLASVRQACMAALLQLHLSGRCHGDARVSNVVRVGPIYKWIDFMQGYSFAGHDGSSVVARDTTMLVKSVYARVKGVTSDAFQVPVAVSTSIDTYAGCFGAVIDKEKAATLANDLVQACENAFISGV